MGGDDKLGCSASFFSVSRAPDRYLLVVLPSSFLSLWFISVSYSFSRVFLSLSPFFFVLRDLYLWYRVLYLQCDDARS